MKKVFSLMIAFVASLVLVGCVNVTTTTTEATTTVTTTKKQADLSEMPESLPFDDEVTVTFWHTYGQGKSALLDQLIAEFQELYPNVTIESTSQGSDYNSLREKIAMGISIGQTPTMAIGYPDHFAGYLNGDAVLALDDFINNEEYGVDLSDFVDSYVAENNQYAGGKMYSMPFSKSTEFMVYNKTVMDHHGITIPTDRALTYDELLAITATVTSSTGATVAADYTCEIGLNFDSSSNLFINTVRQFNGGYTNTAGELLVGHANTTEMLNFLKSKFDTNEFGLPSRFEQNYGSNDFKAGNICMSVGSTAGFSYNIPKESDSDFANYAYGAFEVGVAPIPQPTGAVLPSNPSAATAEYVMSAVQQGPNIGIFNNSTEEEQIAAWYFIKFLTLPDNTAAWAKDTGYLPVRKSGYESADYQAFMQIAQKYWAAGNDMSVLTKAEQDELHSSMVVNVAQVQVPYYAYDPAFAETKHGDITTAGSAVCREYVGTALDNIYNGLLTVANFAAKVEQELTWK